MKSKPNLQAAWVPMAPRKRRSKLQVPSVEVPVKLNHNSLVNISKDVVTPKYRPTDLSAGIVHFGVGNFHRSHQACYLDDLFNLGLDRDWAIIGAGVLEHDSETRRVLAEQDFLTTVVERDAASTKVRVIGSMIDFVDVEDRKALISTMADPAIRIVSMTVTEGGYFMDVATQSLDAKHPDIIHDATYPETPKTVFGLILAALSLRRKVGVPAFTVMSCDNIPGNGEVTRAVLLALAKHQDADFVSWLELNLACPNSMVDRITPATDENRRQFLQANYHLQDKAPVFCETFKQWVIEDHFPAGRPALEKVGVQFVGDVAAYELTKIRMLNGGHATLAYAAAMLNIKFVHDAMGHPVIRAFMEKVQKNELIPTLPENRDIDTGKYLELICSRFTNPTIEDTITRLCYDGSNRQPKFILAAAQDRIKDGLSTDGLALVSALWARYCYGEDEQGSPIEPNDPNWPILNERAKQARNEPLKWLDMTNIYGNLAENDAFAKSFADALNSIWTIGVLATLQRYILAH